MIRAVRVPKVEMTIKSTTIPSTTTEYFVTPSGVNSSRMITMMT